MIRIMVAVALLFTAGLAAGASFSISDSEFVDWTYSDWVRAGAPSDHVAEVSRTTEGANAVLDITTHSFVPTFAVWGVAIYDGFAYDPAVLGGLTNLQMHLDVKSITGRGAGQSVRIAAWQAGSLYFSSLMVGTGSTTSWFPFDPALGIVFEGDPINQSPTLMPDFGPTGAPIYFGFGAGNHISGDYTQLYDNWSLRIDTAGRAVPEPGSGALLALALVLAPALFRRRTCTTTRRT